MNTRLTIDKKNSRLEDLLEKYSGYNDNKGGFRRSRRDEIFSILQPFIYRWVRNYFYTRKLERDNKEIISYTWRCFLYGLERYSKFIDSGEERTFTPMGHFYRYTNYYLKSLAPVIEREFPTEELDWFETGNHCDLLDCCIDVKSFIEYLPKEYQEICIDIFDGKTKTFEEREELGVWKTGQYYEARRVLRLVLKYLIGKKNGHLI
jgi:hypothetical protein